MKNIKEERFFSSALFRMILNYCYLLNVLLTRRDCRYQKMIPDGNFFPRIKILKRKTNRVAQIRKEKKHQRKLHPLWNHHLEDGIMYQILGKTLAIIIHLLKNI